MNRTHSRWLQYEKKEWKKRKENRLEIEGSGGIPRQEMRPGFSGPESKGLGDPQGWPASGWPGSPNPFLSRVRLSPISGYQRHSFSLTVTPFCRALMPWFKGQCHTWLPVIVSDISRLLALRVVLVNWAYCLAWCVLLGLLCHQVTSCQVLGTMPGTLHLRALLLVFLCLLSHVQTRVLWSQLHISFSAFVLLQLNTFNWAIFSSPSRGWEAHSAGSGRCSAQ